MIVQQIQGKTSLTVKADFDRQPCAPRCRDCGSEATTLGQSAGSSRRPLKGRVSTPSSPWQRDRPSQFAAGDSCGYLDRWPAPSGTCPPRSSRNRSSSLRPCPALLSC